MTSHLPVRGFGRRNHGSQTDKTHLGASLPRSPVRRRVLVAVSRADCLPPPPPPPPPGLAREYKVSRHASSIGGGMYKVEPLYRSSAWGSSLERPGRASHRGVCTDLRGYPMSVHSAMRLWMRRSRLFSVTERTHSLTARLEPGHSASRPPRPSRGVTLAASRPSAPADGPKPGLPRPKPRPAPSARMDLPAAANRGA